MDSRTNREIRDQTARYLTGALSLNEFHLWLMPLPWTIDRTNDSLAFETASQIALYMAEYAAGHRTEPEMRGLLGPFLLDPPAYERQEAQIMTVPGMPSAESC